MLRSEYNYDNCMFAILTVFFVACFVRLSAPTKVSVRYSKKTRKQQSRLSPAYDILVLRPETFIRKCEPAPKIIGPRDSPGRVNPSDL